MGTSIPEGHWEQLCWLIAATTGNLPEGIPMHAASGGSTWLLPAPAGTTTAEGLGRASCPKKPQQLGEGISAPPSCTFCQLPGRERSLIFPWQSWHYFDSRKKGLFAREGCKCGGWSTRVLPRQVAPSRPSLRHCVNPEWTSSPPDVNHTALCKSGHTSAEAGPIQPAEMHAVDPD